MSLVCRALSACALVSALAATATPSDRWEWNFTDDTATATYNEILPGSQQTHDLEAPVGAPDFDYVNIHTEAGHSYEVRIDGTQIRWGTLYSCSVCAKLDLVDVNDAVLLPSNEVTGEIGTYGNWGAQVIRWSYYPAPGRYLVRVRGYAGPSDYMTPESQYELRFEDTTYFIPRFNNSATQVTVVVLQNAGGSGDLVMPIPGPLGVSGTIHFYDSLGAELYAQDFALPPNGSYVLNTATIPALAGKSGSATIAHGGPYGALAGKAVALEPATGFTFDTTIVPKPR